jgi:hypothetical protein
MKLTYRKDPHTEETIHSFQTAVLLICKQDDGMYRFSIKLESQQTSVPVSISIHIPNIVSIDNSDEYVFQYPSPNGQYLDSEFLGLDYFYGSIGNSCLILQRQSEDAWAVFGMGSKDREPALDSAGRGHDFELVTLLKPLYFDNVSDCDNFWWTYQERGITPEATTTKNDLSEKLRVLFNYQFLFKDFSNLIEVSHEILSQLESPFFSEKINNKTTRLSHLGYLIDLAELELQKIGQTQSKQMPKPRLKKWWSKATRFTHFTPPQYLDVWRQLNKFILAYFEKMSIADLSLMDYYWQLRHELTKMLLPFQLIEKAKTDKAKQLDLSECGLKQLPHQLWELQELEELKLGRSFCFFNYLEGFRNNYFTNLKEDNEIKSLPSDLKRLPRLKKLTVEIADTSQEDNPLRPIAYLTQLESLILHGETIKDLSPLSNLQELRFLDMSSTGVNDRSMNALSILSNLENLEIIEVKVESFNWLTQFPDLKRLVVDRLSEMKDHESIQQISQLTKIETLITEVVNDVSLVRDLKCLKVISFSGSIQNSHLLSGMPQLTHLEIEDKDLMDFGFLRSLVNLEVLLVKGTQFSDMSLLSDMKKLRQINLSDTKIDSIEVLRDMKMLEIIKIDKTQVESLEPLSYHQHLRILSIYGCPISDLMPIADCMMKAVQNPVFRKGDDVYIAPDHNSDKGFTEDTEKFLKAYGEIYNTRKIGY